jgi:hypothetical protein
MALVLGELSADPLHAFQIRVAGAIGKTLALLVPLRIQGVVVRCAADRADQKRPKKKVVYVACNPLVPTMVYGSYTHLFR